MRVTTNGQVTIPRNIIEILRITPEAEVEFLEDNGRFYIAKTDKPSLSGKFSKARGIASVKMSTNEILSLKDYLTIEYDRSEDAQRCEYNNGNVYAKTSEGRVHNLLSMKLANSLFNHLANSNCQVFQSDMKVAIEALGDTRFYYPDVQVSCEDETDDGLYDFWKLNAIEQH